MFDRAAASRDCRKALAASRAGPNDKRCALMLVFSTASGRMSASSARYPAKQVLNASNCRISSGYASAWRIRCSASTSRSTACVACSASRAAALDASSVTAITARFEASAALLN